MTYNKIYVSFGALRKIISAPVNYQYDVTQILVIQDLELPEYYEVDFCNEGDSITKTMIGTASGVEIPDNYLKTGRNVKAYIVIAGTEEDVQTRYEITIPVTKRPLRDDIPLTNDQQKQVDSLVAALNSGVGRAEAAAEAIQDMDVEAETLAAGSAASVEKTVDPETGAVTLNFGIPAGAKGNQGTPGQDGVTPDFRIGSVETLNPGQSATATITGTPAQPVLNLGIPQGPKGNAGTSDAGEVTYDSTETYQSGTAGYALNDLTRHLSDNDLHLEEIPDTTQAITFDQSGNVQSIVHSRNNTAVRTDVFTFGENTITEVRTLANGHSLTMVTNLTTLETTVTYSEGGNG